MKHIDVITVGPYVRNVARETERNTNIIQETDHLTERLLAGNGKSALVGFDITKGPDRPDFRCHVLGDANQFYQILNGEWLRNQMIDTEVFTLTLSSPKDVVTTTAMSGPGPPPGKS